MTRPYAPGYRIPTDLLLKAYASGVFPMAESADDPEVFWVRPETRGVIPLDAFHVPKSLRKVDPAGPLRHPLRHRFRRRHRRLRRGARGAADRPGSTRRSAKPMSSCIERGHCHSVEAWREGRAGRRPLRRDARRAPSSAKACFRARRDASKVCLVHLVERLRERGFVLLDTQFTTEHLKRFGAIDVPRGRYEKLLEKALVGEAQFFP